MTRKNKCREECDAKCFITGKHTIHIIVNSRTCKNSKKCDQRNWHTPCVMTTNESEWRKCRKCSSIARAMKCITPSSAASDKTDKYRGEKCAEHYVFAQCIKNPTLKLLFFLFLCLANAQTNATFQRLLHENGNEIEVAEDVLKWC